MSSKYEGVSLSESSEPIPEEEKQRRLEEIREAHCVGEWKPLEEGLLEVSLPYGCHLIGRIDTDARSAEIRSVFTKNVSGSGVGSRLMKAFVSEAIASGIEKIQVKEILTPGGLRLTVGIFGEDNLRFFVRPYGSAAENNSEISLEEAKQIITEQAKIKPSRSIDAEADLEELGTEGWEKPNF